jgi:hypothetical protein
VISNSGYKSHNPHFAGSVLDFAVHNRGSPKILREMYSDEELHGSMRMKLLRRYEEPKAIHRLRILDAVPNNGLAFHYTIIDKQKIILTAGSHETF